jgi:hypothetical protein
LEEKLGEGGFGEVWLGYHEKLKERRVFKFCFRADRVRSLKRELTLFRLLKERVGEHPNIVGIYDVYLDQLPYYLVVEYVAGRDLRSWCEGQGGVDKVPLGVKLELVAQVADGLQAAHEAGVIHRDVKPSNILVSGAWRMTRDERRVTSDEKETPPPPSLATRHSSLTRHPSPVTRHPSLNVKLTDFGIGQVVSQEVLRGVSRLGFTETMMPRGSSGPTGTYMYVAPELMAGKSASKGSDLYSLGMVLYQLLVDDLNRPLTTDWADEIADPALVEILRRCFAGDVRKRFARAAQLAESLRSVSQRKAIVTRSIGLWAIRHPWLITGLAALFVLGLVGLTFWLWEQNRALLWQREHPHQTRPYQIGRFDSLRMGSTVFIVSFGLAILACADFLDRKRRRFRLGPPHLLLYGTIGAGEVVFGGPATGLVEHVLLPLFRALVRGRLFDWSRRRACDGEDDPITFAQRRSIILRFLPVMSLLEGRNQVSSSVFLFGPPLPIYSGMVASPGAEIPSPWNTFNSVSARIFKSSPMLW